MRRLTIAILLAAWAGCSTIASARDVRAGDLVIGHPYSMPTPPHAPTAIGYLTIANHGGNADRLISADTPAASSLSVHSMSMDGGMMRMRRVDGGVEIAPGAVISFDPEGDHLMFEGLRRPFKSGQKVPVVLHFQHAGAVRILVEVESYNAR